jgi:hypothetical protein
MKIIYIYALCLIILIISSQCIKKIEHSSNAYYSNIVINEKSQILFDNLSFDSIVIAGIPASYVGYVRLYDDTIYYIDNVLNRIFPIETNGKIHNFKLGKGKGPNEFPGGIIYDYVKTPEGKNFIIGNGWDTYIYDKYWEIINQQQIDWQIKHSMEEMKINPIPNMPGLYSFIYNIGRDRGILMNGYIYYEIFSTHPTFNFTSSKDYYKYGKLFAKLNYKTGVIEKLIGLRSIAYENYEYIGHFSFCTYDKNSSKNQFYLGFQADSLIYVCNNEFVPIRAFGLAGKGMNKNYTEYKGVDFRGDLREIWEKDLENCGYYEAIKYIEDRDILFRSYTKGSNSEYNGLQIYHNEILVADIDVPKFDIQKGERPNIFQVVGYIKPYFITNIFFDNHNERGVIYKFKLDI